MKPGVARPFVAALVVCLTGCPPPKVEPCNPEEEVCTDGGQVPDLCNSMDEALNDPQCALTLGEARQAYVSFAGDKDWYAVRIPASLQPRTLLHANGGYTVPNTAVNFAVNLLRGDGTTSLAQKIDRHGQAAPKPVDMIFPYDEAGSTVLVLVSDEEASTRPGFDAKNPYSIMVELVPNPDVNEPNDTTATAIPLTASGAVLTGQQTGYLATNDDVDRFTFDAPAGKKVVYLHLTAPRLSPPPPYRLSYVLLDPTQNPIAEGVVLNEFLTVDLATARLGKPGTYTVLVKGWKSPNTSTVVAGDLRLQYTLDISIFDEVDANEPNDTIAAPTVVTLGAPGTSRTITGRIGYVPDPDYFAVDLGPAGAPSVLRVRVTPAGGGGRFPALTALTDRQLRVMTQVTTGADATARRNNCKTDAAICPKGYTQSDPLSQTLVESLCSLTDPPMCLWSERNEYPRIPAIRNLEATIPVPTHGGTARYFVVVQDDGQNWADDKDYTLTIDWLPDPDEAARAGLPQQTQTQALAQTASYPSPGGGAEVTGELTFGYGRTYLHDPGQGQGIRGPQDYDAVPTDLDRFELTFPGGLTPPLDRAWALEWDLVELPDGGLPGDVYLDLEFCNGAGCSSVVRGLNLAYDDRQLQSWYGPRRVLWTKTRAGGRTTITAHPAGCFCFEPRFITGGRFYASVGAVDRSSHEPIQYRLRNAYADYPQGYSADGGSNTCPAPGGDAGTGCQFTRNAP